MCACLAITNTANEIGFDARAGKEGRVDTGIVEARHRTAVEPERTRRDDEIRSLQTPITHGRDLGDSRL